MTSTRHRVAVGTAAAVGGVVTAGGLGAAGTAGYFARRVLTPDRDRPDDTLVVAVGPDTVTLGAFVQSVVPGRYGLWLQRGEGHARVGDILATDEEARTVTRALHGVDLGTLAPGPARWNGYYYGLDPRGSLGVAYEQVDILTELGPMAAWLIRPEVEATGEWAVLVHGRGARRQECLRGVKPLRDRGITVLIPSYRNDEGGPGGPDGRYNLGLSEWRDVESAIAYAVTQGAESLVLGGWSMGGAIVMQVLARSGLSGLVRCVVLDAPVFDWADVLAHHARMRHLPRPVGDLSRVMMGNRWGRRLVGVHEAIDVAQTDWVTRADELRLPMLVIHSVDDEFVPVGPSQALARARPDLVTFPAWSVARHAKEWNTAPERWEREVSDFVGSIRPSGAPSTG
ncbi:Secreted protein [Nostocoides japonicum T1-X7]|uniref:Secreted protein n=1 Tax=Nostocoides japonicum T1-X7 TaxID=1194083 RepID=A0A077LYE5_9MICO|nr:alpha/beta fold hydrolase [Tetrasphaera japonica]CCH76999.1 Secreted protein [Tetrasphaera japonica T1-X7]